MYPNTMRRHFLIDLSFMWRPYPGALPGGAGRVVSTTHYHRWRYGRTQGPTHSPTCVSGCHLELPVTQWQFILANFKQPTPSKSTKLAFNELTTCFHPHRQSVLVTVTIRWPWRCNWWSVTGDYINLRVTVKWLVLSHSPWRGVLEEAFSSGEC